jgi:hypothetical protein
MPPPAFQRTGREYYKSPGERFRTDALALMAEMDPALSLPQDAVVFLFHQGHTFV